MAGLQQSRHPAPLSILDPECEEVGALRRRATGAARGDRSTMAEWASLQPDLVRRVGDCVLATGGVDAYIDLRAVCPSWRSAIAKPSPLAAVADLRFRPRQWVMLDGEGPLFLNVSTGRIRRLRRPVLRDFIFVGASDGLLVLGDRECPHAARVLNPLTGDMLCFAAPIPREDYALAAVTGCEPTLIFFFQYPTGPDDGQYDDIPAYYSLHQGSHAVYTADPTSQLCAIQFPDATYDDDRVLCLESMVTYAGDVYLLNFTATLFKIVWRGDHWYAERIVDTLFHDGSIYLVESAGKLLLVQDGLVEDGLETVKIFSVNVEQKLLEPINCIGSCALFLCNNKCLSVDAAKLPSIDGNCIYKSDWSFRREWDTMCVVYDLSSDGTDGFITRCSLRVPGLESETIPHSESEMIYQGPLSLAQVILTSYPTVRSQLDCIDQTERVHQFSFSPDWTTLQNAEMLDWTAEMLD